MSTIRVVGIDCAPGKTTTVFDPYVSGSEGGFREFNASHLAEYLDELRATAGDVLVCWDAPLTGPRNPDVICGYQWTYTKRWIERFFSVKDRYRTPPGISVLGYGGCPHWTISQALLGLPQTQPGCDDHRRPFTLLTSDRPGSGSQIVEVHPALAIWLWERARDPERGEPWHYKGASSAASKAVRDDNRRAYAELVASKAVGHASVDVDKLGANPDKLDAFTAFTLGSLWCAGSSDDASEVGLLGNEEAGAFLLPIDRELTESWGDFLAEEWDKWLQWHSGTEPPCVCGLASPAAS